MEISREELLRQRRLLQQHLEWIDAKLAAGEAESRQPPAPTEAQVPPQSPPPPPVTEPAESDSRAEDILNQYGSNASSSAAQLKFGCIFLTVLLSALALFTFFGLPHLLRYFKEGGEAPAARQQLPDLPAPTSEPPPAPGSQKPAG